VYPWDRVFELQSTKEPAYHLRQTQTLYAVLPLALPQRLVGALMSDSVCVCVLAEERQSPELYASNVRKLMGEALGAELSTHGIPQQQALKRNGIYVDWTGRCAFAVPDCP